MCLGLRTVLYVQMVKVYETSGKTMELATLERAISTLYVEHCSVTCFLLFFPFFTEEIGEGAVVAGLDPVADWYKGERFIHWTVNCFIHSITSVYGFIRCDYINILLLYTLYDISILLYSFFILCQYTALYIVWLHQYTALFMLYITSVYGFIHCDCINILL